MKMKRTRKRIGSLLLSVCMVFTMLPTVAFAEGSNLDSGEPSSTNEITALPVTVTTNSAITATTTQLKSPILLGSGTYDYVIDISDQLDTDNTDNTDGYDITDAGTAIVPKITGKSYCVTGSTNYYYLSVLADIESLTLDNVSINTSKRYALDLDNSYDMKVTLIGENSLIGTANGLYGNNFSQNLTVEGEGSLTSNVINAIKSLAINSGTVNAVLDADTVTINGGTVNAVTTKYTYGINALNAITITGGSINAAGITQATNLQPTNGSDAVYMTTIFGLPANTAVTSLSAPVGYGYVGMKTDNDGKLYLWLPKGNQTVNFTVGTENVNKIFTIEANNENIFAVVDVTTDVTDAAGLKTALEVKYPTTINVTGDINFDSGAVVGANHTLIIPEGKTVTATSGLINIGRNTLTINGGGTFVSKKNFGNTLYGAKGTLNLENITVELKNTSANGISVKTVNVGNGATIVLDSSTARYLMTLNSGYSCKVNLGGKIEIKNFLDNGLDIEGGNLHLNGGTITVNKGQEYNMGILVNRSSTLKYTSGTLNGAEGSVIFLGENAKVEGMNGRLSDRNTIFTASGLVAVGEENAIISANSLTVGYYCWDGTRFSKNIITVDTHPQNVTTKQGEIDGVITASGTTSNGKGVRYQWYKISTPYNTKITGATSSAFTIPTDLAEGIHYYYCVLSADACYDVNSSTGTVTVNAPDEIPVTGVTLNKNNLSLYSNTSPNTATLTTMVAPDNATDKSVTWKSNNTTVATIDLSGNVTAVGNGTATITVTTNDGGYTASCTVTVSTYSSGGGSSSGGSSSGGSSTKITTTTENKPITAVASVTATAGTNGTASASISDKAVTDAISKAQTELKKQGKSANGISVGLNVTMPKGATTLIATLSQNALNSLVSAGVTNLQITGSPVTITFDQKALTEIQKQSSGNVNIAIAPQANLSETAKKIIGTRPIYNITVSYGDNRTVSNFRSGVVTVAIPYTPANGEAIGELYAVYVDDNGNATRVDGSAYDANSGCVIFTTPHFSMYGIGYTAASAKFTDISSHWAKESIDYVVDKGMIGGATETTFAPDIFMTRGTLVTALGRLTDEDVSRYTTSSFTDVKAGRTSQPYIEWAYEKGIIHGVGNDEFAPDRAITREEIAVIIANFAKATGYTLPVTREATTYADASSIGSTYKTAVTAMQQASIMTGGTNNKFNPKSNATRAEVSSMLYRYIQLTITWDITAKE